MMAILSGAWWAQRLTGPVMQAFGVAIACALVLLAIVGGLWWLRNDARRDERAGLATVVAEAKAAVLKDAAAKQAKSEAEAAAAAQKWADEFAKSEATRVELEAKLAALTGARPVVFKRDMVEILNR